MKWLICIFRKQFGMLFFKYILYQKRTKFQAGIVVKKILTKIFANFLKFFVVFDEILSVFISKKDLERFDLEIFFYPKKLSQILSLSRQFTMSKNGASSYLFFPKYDLDRHLIQILSYRPMLCLKMYTYIILTFRIKF